MNRYHLSKINKIKMTLQQCNNQSLFIKHRNRKLIKIYYKISFKLLKEKKTQVRSIKNLIHLKSLE